MEKSVDNVLKKVFGNFSLKLNLIVGAILIIRGIIVLFSFFKKLLNLKNYWFGLYVFEV